MLKEKKFRVLTILKPLQLNLFGVVTVTFEDQNTRLHIEWKFSKIDLARGPNHHSAVLPDCTILVQNEKDIFRRRSVDGRRFGIDNAGVGTPEFIKEIQIC